MNDLPFLQSTLQHYITQTGDVLSQKEEKEIESCIVSSGQLSAIERVNVYRQSYFARLFECFQSEFPCLEYALGKSLFENFAFEYLKKYPSTSYTLYNLSSRFTSYLEESRPDADLPVEEQEEWPSFIIELATLERAFNQVYTADNENKTQQLFRFNYPVYSYFKQWRDEKTPGLPQSESQLLYMTRKNQIVHVEVIDEFEFQYLYQKLK